jgi:hypothetical protein
VLRLQAFGLCLQLRQARALVGVEQGDGSDL